MRTQISAVLLAAAAAVALAGPAAAESVTVTGCAGVTTPAGDAGACAFDTATVYYDEEPLRRSFTSCLYGTPLDWDGVDVQVADLGPEATYDLLVAGSGSVDDPQLGGPAFSTGYVEGGPDLGGGCV